MWLVMAVLVVLKLAGSLLVALVMVKTAKSILTAQERQRLGFLKGYITRLQVYDEDGSDSREASWKLSGAGCGPKDAKRVKRPNSESETVPSFL